jgi:hypothetical protein
MRKIICKISSSVNFKETKTINRRLLCKNLIKAINNPFKIISKLTNYKIYDITILMKKISQKIKKLKNCLNKK